MSSKIERDFVWLDGKCVPLVKVFLEPCDADDNAAWEERDLLAGRIEQMLAAPVGERQPNQCDGCNAGIPVVNGNHRMGLEGGYPDLMGCTAKLYESPPELAELKATIERLTAELKDFQCGASVEAQAGDEARAEVAALNAEIERLKGGQGETRALLERCLNALDSRVAASKSVRTLRMELRKFIQSVPHEHEWDINKEGTATICHCGARSSDFPAEPRATVTVSPVARSLLATIEQLQATIDQQTYALSKTEDLLNDMLRDDDMKAHWFRDRINACLDKVKELNQ